jgi:hypothetical protein
MSNFKQLVLGDMMGGMGVANPAISAFSFPGNTTDSVAVIFQVPDDAGANSVTITRLGYFLSAVTGTSPVMRLSLQSVDASGNPSGTPLGGGSPASVTLTPSGSATFAWFNLANSYTANRGDWLAWVFDYSSGTINASNRPIVGTHVSSINNQHPYSIRVSAGTPDRSAGAASMPIWGFGSAGKAFGFPLQSVTNTAFSSSSTPNERALRFLLSQNACSSYKVVGVRYLGTAAAAGNSTKIILYDGTTVLQTLTWDSDYVAGLNVRPMCLYFQDATLATLAAGKEYRIGIQPQNTTNAMSMVQFDFASNADMEALPGGLDWYLSTRSGGAWTDVPASRPWMTLILGDVTAPSPGIVMATG